MLSSLHSQNYIHDNICYNISITRHEGLPYLHAGLFIKCAVFTDYNSSQVDVPFCF